VLLGGTSALVLAVGSLFGPGGLLVGAAAALAVSGWAWLRSDALALRAMRARPVSEFEAPALHRVVRELSQAARMPMPRVCISPTETPSAFVTGRDPRHAAVCVTTGLLRLLDARGQDPDGDYPACARGTARCRSSHHCRSNVNGSVPRGAPVSPWRTTTTPRLGTT
jgi:hypothetical protein